MKIARALISVSDKTGVAAFARALEGQGIDIISTGGTAELLRKQKIPVRDISSFTAFPGSAGGPGENAPSAGAWRVALQTRQSEAPGRGAGMRIRTDRSGGGEPLSLRSHRRQTGRHPGRSDREYRHRRAGHDPKRGQELSGGDGGGRSGRLRRRSGKHARQRTAKRP